MRATCERRVGVPAPGAPPGPTRAAAHRGDVILGGQRPEGTQLERPLRPAGQGPGHACPMWSPACTTASTAQARFFQEASPLSQLSAAGSWEPDATQTAFISAVPPPAEVGPTVRGEGPQPRSCRGKPPANASPAGGAGCQVETTARERPGRRRRSRPGLRAPPPRQCTSPHQLPAVLRPWASGASESGGRGQPDAHPPPPRVSGRTEADLTLPGPAGSGPLMELRPPVSLSQWVFVKTQRWKRHVIRNWKSVTKR